MSHWRKKPVVIEAFQWTGDQEQTDDPVWIVEAIKRGEVKFLGGLTMTISTLEGDMTAQIGDYIIRGTAGEIYPCKPDIFADIYEAVAV